MEDARTKEDIIYDNPKLIKTPVVRNGKLATAGYCPEIWTNWE
jgi:arsenate reductase-like glutaredoxin family protein